jgi:hypothetical protein
VIDCAASHELSVHAKRPLSHRTILLGARENLLAADAEYLNGLIQLRREQHS